MEKEWGEYFGRNGFELHDSGHVNGG